MIIHDYICYDCGEEQTNHSLELYSLIHETEGPFVCVCGGHFRLKTSGEFIRPFEPYYKPELGHVTSKKHENKLLAEKGLAFMDDHKAMKKRASDIQKHKLEYTQAMYAKEGLKFKPEWGNRATFDEKKSVFRDKRTGKILSAILLMLILSTSAHAKFEGVKYTTINVNGVEYEVPQANKEYTSELFYLKKALRGDKEALEIFLGGNNPRIFFIGDDYARWLYLYADGRAYVKEYPPNS